MLQQLNTEEGMKFVSLRDVILTVKSKLLGANVKDAIVWLKKYLYPVSGRGRFHIGSLEVFVFSQTKGYGFADTDLVRSLYDIAGRHISFIQEACFDKYGYNLDKINLFFANKGIDIIFSKSNLVLQHNNESKNEPIIERESDYSSLDILFLNKFRDDDPLYLAIEIRNKEWVNYNPNDVESRVNQESIVTEFVGRGLSKNQATSIEMVSCPIKRK